MAKRKFILWDHDGVLVDTEHWYFHATQTKLRELGVELSLERYLQRMVHGLSSWDLALESGVEEEKVVAKRRQRDEHYRELLAREDIEIPGVCQTLARLRPHFGMAIVTTSKGADFRVIHRDRNIVPFMDFVLVREDYENSKPDPEPYLLAMERFGASPAECIVVEDSQRGLQAALAAGIDCAIVHNDFTASHDFTGARYRLDTLADLAHVLGVAG